MPKFLDDIYGARTDGTFGKAIIEPLSPNPSDALFPVFKNNRTIWNYPPQFRAYKLTASAQFIILFNFVTMMAPLSSPQDLAITLLNKGFETQDLSGIPEMQYPCSGYYNYQNQYTPCHGMWCVHSMGEVKGIGFSVSGGSTIRSFMLSPTLLTLSYQDILVY